MSPTTALSLIALVLLSTASAPAAALTATCQSIAIALPLPSTSSLVCPAATAPLGDFFVTAEFVVQGTWSDTLSSPRTVQFTFTENSAQFVLPALVANAAGLTFGDTGFVSSVVSLPNLVSIGAFSVNVDTVVFSPDPASASVTAQVTYFTAVPEPNTFALAAAVMGALFAGRRYRRA